MSKFEDINDSTMVICPYCKYEYQPECEDFSESPREEECEECGKKYHLRQIFSVDHETGPDCELNGDAHVYEPYHFKDGSSRGFCSICGQIQPRESGVADG